MAWNKTFGENFRSKNSKMAGISSFKQKNLNLLFLSFSHSSPQICHQIINIWHQIKHLTNFKNRWDIDYVKKKTHIVSHSKTKFFIKLSKYIMKKNVFIKILDEKMQKRLSYVQLIFDCHGGNIYCQWTWT